MAIAVDDALDIDDIVGGPIELQVMRWTPMNEMGVVALFIEFRMGQVVTNGDLGGIFPLGRGLLMRDLFLLPFQF